MTYNAEAEAQDRRRFADKSREEILEALIAARRENDALRQQVQAATFAADDLENSENEVRNLREELAGWERLEERVKQAGYVDLDDLVSPHAGKSEEEG